MVQPQSACEPGTVACCTSDACPGAAMVAVCMDCWPAIQPCKMSTAENSPVRAAISRTRCVSTMSSQPDRRSKLSCRASSLCTCSTAQHSMQRSMGSHG